MQFWIRAAILFAATAPSLVASGFHLPWWQVFLLALAGALLGHLVVWIVKKRRGAALICAVAAAVGGVVAGFYLRRGAAPAYLVEVDEVVAHPSEYQGRHVRIHGYAQPGTLRRGPGGLELAVGQHDQALRVRYAGLVPDELRDGMEVVAGGRLEADRTFNADQLVVKCPSNYDRNAGSKPF